MVFAKIKNVKKEIFEDVITGSVFHKAKEIESEFRNRNDEKNNEVNNIDFGNDKISKKIRGDDEINEYSLSPSLYMTEDPSADGVIYCYGCGPKWGNK